MTAPSPEQIRALASKMLATADWVRDEMPDLAEEIEDGVIALRAAADQLEAVRAWVDEHHHHFAEISELDAILTADTAPREPDQWVTTTEYAYGARDAPDIIVPTGEDIDDLGTARYNAEEFWIDVLQRTVKRGPWTVVPAPQEDRMSKCDWPECPGYPATVEKHEIESGPELHPQCKDAILLAERARREGWHTAPQQDRDE
jgi:hypothetical protein